MKTGKKILIGVVVLAMLVTLLSNLGQVFDFGKVNTAYAASSVWTDDGKPKTIKTDTKGSLGSASNPFVVLEVVPSYRQAQFGYLSGGNEPIDISEVSKLPEGEEKTKIAENVSAWLKKQQTERKAKGFKEDFTDAEWNDYTANYLYKEGGVETADRYGYYERIPEGIRGDYTLNVTLQMTPVTSTEDTDRDYYLKVSEAPSLYVYADNIAYPYNADLFEFDPIEDIFRLEYLDGNKLLFAWGGRYRYDDEKGYVYAGRYQNGGEILDDSDFPGLPKGYVYVDDENGFGYKRAKFGRYRVADADHERRLVDEYYAFAGDYFDLKDDDSLKKIGYNSISAVINKYAPGALLPIGDELYLKVNDETLQNRIAEKDANGRPFQYYCLEYVCKIEPAEVKRTGEYRLVNYSYEDSLRIANEEDISTYNGTKVLSQLEYDYEREDLLRVINAKPAKDTPVFAFYKWKLVSEELFKKYALGLIYTGEDYINNEDISGYEFLGWYYDKEGVNIFNVNSEIKRNITLYAKWRAIYSDETRNKTCNVRFNKNVETDAVVEDFDFSSVITGIAPGNKIVAPKGTPHLKDKLFTGWYEDSACTKPVTFPYTVKETVTLYAGWANINESDRTYKLRFDANAYDYTISGMPGSVIEVYKNNRDINNNAASSLIGNPTRDNYDFGGWYLETSCIHEYDFDANATNYSAYADESGTINLYALWIRKNENRQYTVSFNVNKPDTAVAEPRGNTASFSVAHGKTASEKYNTDDHILTLAGNIQTKLNSYNVKVVTVTPKELTDSNLSLIKQANLIVFSQPIMLGSLESMTAEGLNNALKERFDKYRNKDLFPDNLGRNYSSTKYKFTDSDNDISFNAAKYVLMKSAGNQTGTYGDACPIIYDYNIYKTVVSTSGKSAPYEGTLSDGTALNLSSAEKKGWNNNLYKLYLMTQQMNANTLYNAYFTASDVSPIKGFSIGTNGDFKTSAGSYGYWNKYTLIPWNSVSPADYEDYKAFGSTKGFDLLGVTIDAELPSDDSAVVYSKISNRILIFNNYNKKNDYFSVSRSFCVTSAFPSSSAENKDMAEILGAPHQGDAYSVADGIHFMLNDTTEFENYNKDISVLELEPAGKYKESGHAESFKSEEYWFWMISRYVPNYTGTTSVTRMSTEQFIGDISNLNSDYDVIYIGGNDKGIVPDGSGKAQYMPDSPKKALFKSGQANAFVIGVKAASGQKVKDYYEWIAGKTEVTQSGESNNVAEHPLKLYFDYDAASPNLRAASGVSIDSRIVIDFNRTMSDVDAMQFYGITFKYDGKALTASFRQSDEGNIYIMVDGEWVKGDYYISYNLTSTPGKWSDKKTGTVTAGQRIYLQADQELKTIHDTYVYAHTGKLVKTGTGTNVGKSETLAGRYTSGYLLTGSLTPLEYAASSGNDITNVKETELMDFVNAGYPVIIGSDLLTNEKQLDTSIVDTASYIYRFLNTISAGHDNVFYENIYEVAQEDAFVKALNNKSFKINLLAKPVEYHDRTYKDGDLDYTKYTEAQIYVNGVNRQNRTLKYVFTIEGDVSDDYSLNFYIDSNADGRFNEETERVDSAEIALARYTGDENNASQKADPDKYVRVSGSTNPDQTSLKASSKKDKKIYLLMVPTGDTIGGIPWKLEIESNRNRRVTDEESGLCAIKALESGNKAEAYVLQILPDYNKDATATVVFPDAADIKTAKGTKLTSVSDHCRNHTSSGDVILKTAQMFYDYTRKLNDFEVEFFKLTANELQVLVEERNARMEPGINGELPELNELTPFWIKVVSSAQNVNMTEEDLARFRARYPDREGNILVEHGSTYDSNTKKYKLYYSLVQVGKELEGATVGFVDGVLTCKSNGGEGNVEDINMMFVGFADVYGYGDIDDDVCNVINEFISSGKAVLFTHDTTSYWSHYTDGSSLDWGVNINSYFRDILKLDRYDVLQFAGTANAKAGDLPYKTGGTLGKDSSVLLSNMVTAKAGSTDYAMTQGYTKLAMTGKVGSNGTTRVTKSNEGQLTSYPYYIPDEMDVANTHAQYWQIDFEDNDIVVWYSLANPKNNLEKCKCYTTLNDVRNNYYIYSAGNVTYSGVGHDPNLTANETKLFINTMVAAYKSIASPAEPIITNADKSSVYNKNQYLYVSYDETETVAIDDSTVDADGAEPIGMEIKSSTLGEVGDVYYQRVFFRVKSSSLVTNKKLTVHFYPEYTDPVTNATRVFQEYQMHLPVYRVNPGDPYNGTGVLCKESDKFKVNFNDSMGINVNANRVWGYEVEANTDYYVDIPISDNYYRKLFSESQAGELDIERTSPGPYPADDFAFPNAKYHIWDGSEYLDAEVPVNFNFALDSNSNFRIKLEVIMRYGKDITAGADEEKFKNTLTDSVNIIFTKRGLFMLD